MLGVVLAGNGLLLYTCWELTSVTSYLLIGNDHTSAKARAAALHALLVTVAGGLVMLGGFVVLAQSAGSYRLPAILDAAPSGTGGSVEIGRASCWERVCPEVWIPGYAVNLKKKK